LSERFRDIGGLYKLLELAGYTVIQNWDRSDYIEWGIKVMRANDGEVPSQSMVDYLSQQDKGPSASIVTTRFDGSMTNFQREVIEGFYRHKQETEACDQEQLSKIEADIKSASIQLELFSPMPYNSPPDDPEGVINIEELEALYKDGVSAIVHELGIKGVILRYAKFKVINILAPSMETDTKLNIARGLTGRSFVPAMWKSANIPANDIEYVALTEGFFDYIWPDDEQIENLRMDGGYRNMLDRKKLLDRERRAKKKASAAA
jgi:hypothetical protein